ncbi:MAG: hypothetical protein IJN03_02630 [Bacilli bacterium]|nr:hypothetical protein [Bacilli bacterium]
MQPKTIVLHIWDDELIIWYKEKTYIEKLSNRVISYGKIFNPSEFIKYFEKIIKKYGLNKGIFNYNVTVVTEPITLPSEKEIIKMCLEKLAFNKINYINIADLYNLNYNKVYLKISNNYIYLTKKIFKGKKESIYIDQKLFKNNINLFANHLSVLLKNKKIIIIGNVDNLESYSQLIERNSNNQTYYVDNSYNYIINNLINTLKK